MSELQGTGCRCSKQVSHKSGLAEATLEPRSNTSTSKGLIGRIQKRLIRLGMLQKLAADKKRAGRCCALLCRLEPPPVPIKVAASRPGRRVERDACSTDKQPSRLLFPR